ncbi:GNAT family N-acetyltransferase [Microvirga lotononidis]|uniref:Acetyltransferase n=1 Tax=Microvirga lotononidis TaxID=864069 RepID=I4YZR2_9HYPH|nr:GNAT family N-acetyltransferase [Microvirga lotononidis]EIM29454.1 acetyltransferase [Microvirga lotononidis]WQO27227.1 GNAT family N-acetyltransferase [Microvirga lotononidis]
MSKNDHRSGATVSRVHYIIEQDTKALLNLLPEIQALADSEKNDALGFIPSGAFEDAIERRRLIAALVDSDGDRTFAGYLLHSGVFPNAKIQQIAATPPFRGKGAASALMKALVSELERVGFVSIRADVASNLTHALNFYARNGFEPIRQRAGGKSRGRTIIIHSRTLESDNLLTLATPHSEFQIDLSRRRASVDPVFAFDLNVYFDLVRDRSHSENARQLFGAALAHTIKLAVAEEFVTELRNTSSNLTADPILQMALQLPRLPKCDRKELEALAVKLYDVVFKKPNAKGLGTEQAKSDVKHLAHAALSRASAFVTRDGSILNARNELLETFDIDIATIDEVLDLIPNEASAQSAIKLQGNGFDLGPITRSELCRYLSDVNVDKPLSSEFTDPASVNTMLHQHAIRCEGRVVAVGILAIAKRVDPVARMLIHVRNEIHDAELFADYLIDFLIRSACEGANAVIELAHLPGQSIVNQAARLRGFHRAYNAPTFSKIAVGKPITADTWNATAQQVRRRAGIVLPHDFDALSSGVEIPIKSLNGRLSKITAQALEDFLSPTLIVWRGRNGVIVPIAREYADELLGTAIQAKFDFILNRQAAFRSRRGYVNSPRAARLMSAGAPIIFYESKRTSNGRGAAVAIARITNSVVISKSQIDPKSDQRLVVDDLDKFSASEDVLLTTFDNIMRFPNPVSFEMLKKFDAIGRANLVSAVSISSDQIESILNYGWSCAKS